MRWIVVLGMVVNLATAHGEEHSMAATWRLDSELPFTSTDLERAIAARIYPATHLGCTKVSVSLARTDAETSLLVSCDDHHRRLQLRVDLDGDDAARSVAIALVHLAGEPLAPLAPLPSLTTPLKAEVSHAKPATTPLVRNNDAPATSIRLVVGGIASRGVQSTDVFWPGAKVGLGWVRNGFGARAEIRYQQTLPATTALTPSLRRVAGHAQLGVERGYWHAMVGLGLEHGTVRRTTNYSNTYWSAGIGSGVAFPLGTNLSLVTDAEFRWYSRRVSVEFQNDVVATSPRVGITVSTSMRWIFGT